MRKGITKAHVSLTLDKTLVAELKRVCRHEVRKLSPFLEHLVRQGWKQYKQTRVDNHGNVA